MLARDARRRHRSGAGRRAVLPATAMSAPLVTVVIPAYNAAAFLRDAIESVLAQTYRPLEVIVVDDGSTDDTAAIAQSFGPPVRCIRQANARQAAARNRGIREAAGELFAFLDADDTWDEEKLAKQVARLERDADLGLVYCCVREVDAAGRSGAYRQARLRGRAWREVLLGVPGGGVCGSTFVVPRRVLDAVGLFDESLAPCEDTELLWRVASAFPIDFIDEPLVCYRVHTGNDHWNVDRMARAWTSLYEKALDVPAVKAEGRIFRARCRGRLFYMLAGDYARGGRWGASIRNGLRAVLAWPPLAGRIVAGLAGRRPPTEASIGMVLPRPGTDAPLVSVVIPAYNAAAFLRAAIESVLAQTFRSFELIVVDDGSTDETAAIARSFGARLRYVRQQNARQAAARNHGLRESRGALIAFLDADDLWREDKLAKQVALLQSDPALGLVYCSMTEIDAAGRCLGELPARLRGHVMRDVLLGRGGGGGGLGSTAVVRREVFEAVGDFDSDLPPCEDTDFFWRAASRYAVDFVDEPLVSYRQHSESAHVDVDRMARAWTRLYAKALRAPAVRAQGLLFRARCRGRLFYMLSGDYARQRRWGRAVAYALRAALAWPPQALRMMAALVGRRSSAAGRGADGVLYVAYWGLLEPLGQSLVLSTVRALAERGQRVCLVTFEKAADTRDGGALAQRRAELAALGVRWSPLRYHKRPTLPATGFDVLQGVAVALWVIVRHRPRLVHGRTFLGGVIGLAAARLTGRRWIYHNEGFWPDQQVEGGFWPAGGSLYRFTKAIERFLYRHADGLILLSERSVPIVRALPGVQRREPPIVVAPSTVDLPRFAVARERSDSLRLIYLGSLGGRYPIDQLGRFAAAVRRIVPSARLVVLSQSAPDVIRAGLLAEGLPEEAFTISRVPHDEVPAWLSRADAGLFFLRGGIGAESCSPTKTGEYWAAGLPVVSSPAIGDTEAIIAERQVGVVVDDPSAGGMMRAAQALLALLATPDLASRCRRAAEDHYALRRSIDDQLALYRRLG
jgi:glycosyltransferase involved in cell wall biosynthesis